MGLATLLLKEIQSNYELCERERREIFGLMKKKKTLLFLADFFY
jgi:hypothetical protein